MINKVSPYGEEGRKWLMEHLDEEQPKTEGWSDTLTIELSRNTVRYFSKILDMHLTPVPEKELIEACKKSLEKENYD